MTEGFQHSLVAAEVEDIVVGPGVVGAVVGEGVGAVVGEGVGARVGEGVGAGVDTGVGEGVGAVLGAGVDANMGDVVGARVVAEMFQLLSSFITSYANLFYLSSWTFIH